jgi:F-type H+-transporting ATPase subunit epsilon
MSKTIQCDIVSARESIYSGKATIVIAHGAAGDLGIMPGHTALLTQLAPGPIQVVKENGEADIYYVSAGFLEVQPNLVTVLADFAERAKDIDEASAEAARKAALDMLHNQQSDMDTGAALAALAEAAAQLRTLQQLRNRAGRG